MTGQFSVCEGGEKSLRCRDCRASWKEELEAQGHSYQNGECAVCGDAEPTNIFITEYAVEGDVVTVTVKLTDVVKVAGFTLTVGYDSNVLYLSETSQTGTSFASVVNSGNAGEVIIVHSNSVSTRTEGLVLTMTFLVDSFENTEITLTVNEIKETWYDASIHNTASSASGAVIPLAQ